ncbi:hypothetical protein [Kutzneria buriramensis]|uniref:hypothetical protein n=1 Tax=Kutzneria buriramensis TaxID=1045776 RepID=UPI000E2248ED|nr:hypothetical protein [Kutzneria buriramensis]
MTADDGAADPQAAMWQWAEEQASLAPRWSEARWNLVNAILDIRLHEPEAHVFQPTDTHNAVLEATQNAA